MSILRATGATTSFAARLSGVLRSYEASRGIPNELKNEFAEQPWPEIAAIGNLLRHSYDRVDDLIMWKIATRSLPEFRPAIVAASVKAEQ